MKGFEIVVDAMLYAAIFGAMSAALAYAVNNGVNVEGMMTGLAVTAKNLAIGAMKGNLLAAATLGAFAGITYYAARQTYKIVIFLGIFGALLLALTVL